MSPRTTVFVLLLCLPAVFSYLFGRRSVEVDKEDYDARSPQGRRFVGEENFDGEEDAPEPRIGHRSFVKEALDVQPPPRRPSGR